MRRATRKPRGFVVGTDHRLEDIDFTDDLCLMSHNLSDMREKIEN